MFEKKYLDQVRLLLNILPLIGKHEEFAVKGGTAINFFVFDIPRLSVDIDLCYLPIEERKKSFENMNLILQDLSDTLKRRLPDFSLNVGRRKNANVGKLIVSGDKASVKIEPNEVLRGSVLAPEKRLVSRKVGNVFNLSPEAKILSVPDLFAGKICAALDRQHPRDFFDIRMMFKNGLFNRQVKKVFLIYLIQSNRPISEMLDPAPSDIQKPFQNEFAGMIEKEIAIDQLYSAREELIDRLNRDLTADEKEFLLSVKSGAPDWEKSGIGDFSYLPGVQWKLKNINKMSKEKKQAAYTKLEGLLFK